MEETSVELTNLADYPNHCHTQINAIVLANDSELVGQNNKYSPYIALEYCTKLKTGMTKCEWEVYIQTIMKHNIIILYVVGRKLHKCYAFKFSCNLSKMPGFEKVR